MWSLSTTRNEVSLQYQNVKPQYYKESSLQYQNVTPQYYEKWSKFTVPECEASVLREMK